MKRLIVTAVLLALLALVAVSVTSAAVRKWNEDVNNDGAVNILDPLKAAKVAFGIAPPTLATDTLPWGVGRSTCRKGRGRGPGCGQVDGEARRQISVAAAREVVIPFTGGGDGPSVVCSVWCASSVGLRRRCPELMRPIILRGASSQQSKPWYRAIIQRGLRIRFAFAFADVTDGSSPWAYRFAGFRGMSFRGVPTAPVWISGAFTLPAGERLYSLQFDVQPHRPGKAG